MMLQWNQHRTLHRGGSLFCHGDADPPHGAAGRGRQVSERV